MLRPKQVASDFSMAITSCANVTCFNLFDFLQTNDKVYHKYHITQFTIDSLLSLMSSLKYLEFMQLQLVLYKLVITYYILYM